MNKIFISIIMTAVALLPLQSLAQGLKTSGSNATDIVPNGWESIYKTGDLNGDGIADLVLIATPCDKDKMKTRDDGYVYNFNQPVLAVFWGEKNGNFKLFKQYDNVIPAREDEFTNITPTLEITNKGVLKIMLEYFFSAGTWVQPTTTHVFRYQNGDFFLIGSERIELERNTGKTVETSENYLTHKRIVTTTYPKRKKPTIKNTPLPRTMLKPIGFNLDE